MIFENMFVLLFSDFTVNIGSMMQVASKFECGMVCTGTLDCSSFFYNPETKSCLASTTRYLTTSGLVPASGFQYYILRPDCDNKWTVINDQCYKLGLEGQPANSAHDSCQEMGGFLAKTDSAVDNEIIKSIRHKYGTGVWLGGSDQVTEGTWLWRDGTPVTPTFWAAGQPDGGTAVDDCIEQWGYIDGWNDGQCWFPLPVCAKSDRIGRHQIVHIRPIFAECIFRLFW